MKRFLLILIISSSTVSYGQVNYYEGKDTLHIGNEIYRIERYEDVFIYISNIKNTKKSDEIFYVDGTPVPEREVFYKIENNGDNAGLWRAARETFTPEEIASLYDERISIGYYVLPDGTVTDVKFTIPQKDIFYSIPPEKWATLEKKIKKYEKFQLSGAEKYQFVAPGGGLRFKDVYTE